MSTIAPHAHEAPVQSSISKFEDYLDANFRKLVYLCIALILGTAAFFFLKYRSQVAAEEAAMAATAVMNVEDCDIVLQKYKGTVAAGNALLSKSKLLWDQNKKDKAVEALRDFTTSYKDHPFYVQALLSLGSRLEALGTKEAAEAKTIFEKIVSEHKNSEVAGLAQIRIADLLWSEGKEDDARKIYDELPRKFIGQFVDRVTERTEWINSTLPTKEVEGPKVPDALKAPATAPGGANAPAINLTPGKNGSPFGTSKPFEVKAQPAPAGTPGTLGAPIKVGQPKIENQPKVKIAPPQPVVVPANPAPAPAAAPKPAAPAPTATSAPVPTPSAPAPAPAPEAPKSK